jgi:hypothetical protein
MRKVSLFAVTAAVIATGVVVWAAAPTKARAPSVGQGIDPLLIMTNASGLSTTEFADYTFVFR